MPIESFPVKPHDVCNLLLNNSEKIACEKHNTTGAKYEQSMNLVKG